MFLLFIKAVIAVGFPHLKHFKVVFLDKRLNLAELLIGQCTLLLYDRTAVTANKELCGETLGQAGIAGVNVHALNDAEGSVVQIVPANLVR